MVTASVVLYKTPKEQINQLFDCIRDSTASLHLYLIDNSPEGYRPDLSSLPASSFSYIKAPANRGYGAGHNIALRKILESSEFHFVLNPDIRFDATALERMVGYMRQHDDIGQLMPKVLYPDGSLQYLCKLIPTPLDLALRWLAAPPFAAIANRRMMKFELRFTGYDNVMEVPYLSGCFMLFRVRALREVGIFDERFFMYPEDIDITRRMHARFRTVFYPGVSVVHEHGRESYKNMRYLWIHARNMIVYFNKWGWIFDDQRRHTNRQVLETLKRVSGGDSV